MNEKLNELYSSIYSELMGALSPFAEVSQPLLCHVPDGFAKTSIRLMIVGQQTYGWGRAEGADSVAALTNLYQSFDLARTHCNRGRPFWRTMHRLFNGLNPAGPKRSFIWSNVVKVDQYGKRPSFEVEEIVSKYPLLSKEIQIIQPGAVVFFTGPNYDVRLKSTFPDCRFEQATSIIARIVHPELPRSTFRTYHPGYLNRISQLPQVIDDLTSFIQEDQNT